MRKYYKQIVTWSAIALAAITLIFCFLPSAVKQGIGMRINMFFTVPLDVPVKLVSIGGTLREIEEESTEGGILIDINYGSNDIHLIINDYPYENIDFLKNCEFSNLAISRSKIKDISSLTGTNLRYLWIIDTPLEDISVLADVETLEFLCLANTKVKNLAPIRKLKKITRFYFYGPKGININLDISPLANLEELTRLRFRNIIIHNLLSLRKSKYLTSLSIVDSEVKDFSGLASLKELELLDLQDTKITDLKPIAGLMKLKYLYLNDTNVEDLSPLKNLKLKSLNIRGTPAAKLPLPEWTKSIYIEK